MRPISLLVFDLDGTLIDSKRDIANSVHWTLKELGLPQVGDDVIYSYVGNGVRPLIQMIELSAKRADTEVRPPHYFRGDCSCIPCCRMCWISRAWGIPSSVAGLKPNGPPSVLATNVMLSPCA